MPSKVALIFLLGITLMGWGLSLAAQNQPLLQIDSPANAVVVNPGQTITVSVSSPAGATFNMVDVNGEGPLGTSNAATGLPAQFSLTVASGYASRQYMLTAEGVTTSGASVDSTTILIDVERPDTPVSLSTQFQSLIMESQGQSVPTVLMATFSDASILDVTESSNVTYQSSNTNIASVDANGIATAVGVGATSIVATYNNPNGPNLQLSIPITVMPFALTFSPPALNFGNVNLGGSATLSVTATNSSASNGSLSVRSIGTGGPYSETDNCLSSSPLAVGATCTISVTFTPSALGPATGTLTVSNSASGVPTVIPLNGSGTVAPVITGVSPTSGAVNSTVVVTGTSFKSAQGFSVVTFKGPRLPGSPNASVLSWSDTSITVSVPSATLPSSSITVNVGGVGAGSASNTVGFTVVAPVLTSLSPTSGPAGTTITLTGSNFGPFQGREVVVFGNGLAPVVTWSDTNIVATVPQGASTNDVYVWNAYSPYPFQSSNGIAFVVPLVINSASPTSGNVGATVTLSGSSFGESQGSSVVSFNGIAATVANWSDSSITTTVPSDATTGPLMVTVGGQSSNSIAFTVTGP